MTTVRRSYIRPAYEQYVDDNCLEWKSIPMAVVKDLVKVSHEKNDYTGIKQVYNLIPPRPKDINAMATSIARINNLPNSAVAEITKKIAGEETALVKAFVEHNPPIEDFTFNIPTQTYDEEQPSRSSSGTRLEPIEIASSRGIQTFGYGSTKSTQTLHPIYPTNAKRSLSVLEGVSLLLGDDAPTSGVVPFNVDLGTQTEWIMNKEKGYSGRDTLFGSVKPTADYEQPDYGPVRGVAGAYGFHSGGMATQTELTKPASFKRMSGKVEKHIQRFYESPENNQATFVGTPTARLPRSEKIDRLIGEHYAKREGLIDDIPQ